MPVTCKLSSLSLSLSTRRFPAQSRGGFTETSLGGFHFDGRIETWSLQHFAAHLLPSSLFRRNESPALWRASCAWPVCSTIVTIVACVTLSLLLPPPPTHIGCDIIAASDEKIPQQQKRLKLPGPLLSPSFQSSSRSSNKVSISPLQKLKPNCPAHTCAISSKC